MITYQDIEKTLDRIINELNSITTHSWAGSIQQDDNKNYYLLLDSLTVHAVVEIDLSFKEIKPTFNFYHKNLQIISLGQTNLFKGYTEIIVKVKQAIKDLQNELKNL